MNEIMNFIKPELMILVPMLYIVGRAIKNTKIIHNSHIPFALGIIGIVLASIYNIATSDLNNYKSLLMSVFVGITQGITCAGLSVYANQLIVVQPMERKKMKNYENIKSKKKSSKKNSTNDKTINKA